MKDVLAGTYDYVIVGAGSAGSVLSDRLTEDGKTTVCVLEAGGWDTSPLIRVPAGFVRLNSHTNLTWGFETEPTENTAGRRIRLPQGKVVGGSSSINGMVYNRGQREDFDDWAAAGNDGWRYSDVLPYFRRTERRVGSADDEFRGRKGNLPVTDHDWRDPLSEAFLDGLGSLGIARNPDYNGAFQEGAGYFQRVIDKGCRVSAACAFLHPARRRKNLDVRPGVRVTRITIAGGRATGVRFVRESHKSAEHVVQANREVILCAGAINTPKLLQLSGIGPQSLLRDLGIAVERDMPGVGEGLRDHYAVRMVSAARDVDTINEYARGLKLGGQVARWLLGRPSILALAPSLAFVFARSPHANARPDLQFVFTPGSYRVGKVYSLDRYPGMTCGFCQQRPSSVGFVRARSADPFAQPVVQPNYLDDVNDRAVVIAALRMVRRFLGTPAMARYYSRETLPGPQVTTDDELLDYARNYGITSFHYVGTARMGAADDLMAVGDPTLRVHGIAALRVVDASVMPMITSANTYAATLMIAEKAADLIRGVTSRPFPTVAGRNRNVAAAQSRGHAIERAQIHAKPQVIG